VDVERTLTAKMSKRHAVKAQSVTVEFDSTVPFVSGQKKKQRCV
jgi:hypothetical protein